MNLYWSVLPLHTRIIEILQKKRGTLTDSELYQLASLWSIHVNCVSDEEAL